MKRLFPNKSKHLRWLPNDAPLGEAEGDPLGTREGMLVRILDLLYPFNHSLVKIFFHHGFF